MKAFAAQAAPTTAKVRSPLTPAVPEAALPSAPRFVERSRPRTAVGLLLGVMRWFGPVSLSVLAAFAHIGGQLLLARLWLVPHDGLFALAPLFAGAALFFGTLNGLIAAKLLAENPVKAAA